MNKRRIKITSRLKQEKEISFKHSGDVGDLWYSLPIIKKYGKGNVYLNPFGLRTKKVDGTRSGFTKELIDLCIPLLEAQPYVNKASVWDGRKVTIDIDNFRKEEIDNMGVNLCEWILRCFGIPFSYASDAWIHCDKRKSLPPYFPDRPDLETPPRNFMKSITFIKMTRFSSVFPTNTNSFKTK